MKKIFLLLFAFFATAISVAAGERPSFTPAIEVGSKEGLVLDVTLGVGYSSLNGLEAAGTYRWDRKIPVAVMGWGYLNPTPRVGLDVVLAPQVHLGSFGTPKKGIDLTPYAGVGVFPKVSFVGGAKLTINVDW